MALDQTPGVVQTLPRDKVRDNFLRSYQVRVPGADVGPNGQPYVDGSVAADAVAPLYSDAVTIGRGTTLSSSAGTWLQTIGEDEGVFPRPAVGASGFIGITASAGGTNILVGTVVRSKLGQKRYQVAATALYTSATPVPVLGIDTGPGTNLDPGAAMEFPSPPPGCSADAVVLADSDGNGLSGGRNADDDATYRQLISDHRANPPASGNDAEYQQRIKQTPGLSVQRVWTFPAILGPGTTGYVFTLNPARPGASRVPNSAQVASTLAYVLGLEPGDDGVFACDLVESPVPVALRMTWGVGASQWQDVSPWPAYVAGDQVRVAASPSPSFTSFNLFTGTTTADPQAGQTIGFYDPATGAFKRLRIGAVAINISGKSWTITPDRSFGASDPSYIPVPGQAASPWSESLNTIVPAVVKYFDGLGPGEQVSPLPDPGTRQRRQPPSPQSWTSLIDARIVIPIYALGTVVETVTPLAPALPYQTPVGIPAALSYLSTLGDLAIYP